MGEAGRKAKMDAGSDGWRDTHVPKSPCPYCDAPLNATTSPKGYVPVPGCFSVCIECAQLLIFRDDLTLRAVTTAEFKEIEREHPKFFAEITIMQRAVRAIDRRTADE
jgi:hypothetical protein